MDLDTDLTPFTKMNSKWITELNVKCKTIKLLEDNLGENVHDLEYGDITFVDIIQTVTLHERKVTNRTLLKFKNFTLQKTLSRE